MAKGQDARKAGAPYRSRAETPTTKTAKAHKRRLLRRLGLRVTDLDGLTAEYLTDWALARALVDHATNNRTRATALNSEQRALAVLAERLDARAKSDPIETLAEQGRAIAARRRGSGSRSSAPSDSSATTEGDGSPVPLPSNDERTKDE